MKIASFYGLTAPVILMLKDSDCIDIPMFVNSISNPVDSTLLVEANKEVCAFKKVLDNLPTIYHSSFEKDMEAVKAYSGVKIVNGIVSGIDESKVSSDDLLVEIKRILISRVSCKILSSSDSITYVNGILVDDYVISLSDKIDYYLSSAKVTLPKLVLHVDKIYNSLIVKNSSGEIKNKKLFSVIKSQLDVLEELDEKRIGDNFTEVDYKIVKKLWSKREILNQIVSEIKSTSKKDIKVFDNSFDNMVLRKPSSILYCVISKFDYVKDKGKSQFFNKTYNLVKSDLEVFIDLFNQRVRGFSHREYQTTLDPSGYLGEIVTERVESKEFIKYLVDTNCIILSTLSKEDLQMLVNAYELISGVGFEFLNDYFGVALTKDSWELEGRKLCQVGIGGITLKQEYLLTEFAKVVSFSATNYLYKSDDVIEEYKRNLQLVSDLLDTMIPIGTRLKEVV